MSPKRRPPTPPTLIASVDPGEHAGWAIRRVGGGVIASGHVRGDRAAEIAAVVAELRRIAAENGPTRLVVESQRPFKMSWASARTLVRRAAAWVHEWERLGDALPSTWVEPDPWQRAVLGASGKMDREARIAMAMRVAALELRRDPATPDEASAVCIGLWAARIVETGGVL